MRVLMFADRRPGLNPRGLALDVDGYRPDVVHVKDDEGDSIGDVGDPVIIVAAAPNLELYPELLGAEHGGLDVVYVQRGDDDGGLWGGWSVEAAVSDVGLEDSGVGSVAGAVDYG
ncbi:FAD-binding Berberine family protein [Actinidia rufa]|uniref:FAD-binding Berberine family protein n=1 Tax=Actinidia rufa TaxID=165716 RepID=A0A7J0DWP6_9ERIC|nr:FAD-binding Berberine family protein [Actinidia rufa]